MTTFSTASLDVMKKYLTLPIFWMVISSSQASDNVLSPCTPMPHGSRLRALMIRGVEAEPLITFTVIPSFKAEYGWSLYEKDKAYVLRFVRFRTSVWSDPGWSKPRPEGAGWMERHMDVHESTVDDGFAKKISKFVEAELAVVEKRPDGEVMMDGVSYEVTKAGMCGEAWSPVPKSRIYELVGIFESLENVARAWTDSGRRRREAKIEARIENLTSFGVRQRRPTMWSSRLLGDASMFTDVFLHSNCLPRRAAAI